MNRYLSIALAFLMSLSIYASTELSGVRVYINPGHGGYDGDDRHVQIYPYEYADTLAFWESWSNLRKAFHLKEMLDNAGAETMISRTKNRTEDDLSLSRIVALNNGFQSDFFISIHSNAGGAANYILMLYSGVDPGDDVSNYNDVITAANSDESRRISTVIADNLYENKINVWGGNVSIRGDKTFAKLAMGWSNGYGVLRGLETPGVISEGSMHDYIPETYRLMNDDYRWMEAWNFYRSFAMSIADTTLDKGVIAGSLKDSKLKIMFPSYYKIPGSRDEMLPLHGASVYLIQGTDTVDTYVTDSMYNGVYVFKNVLPGSYTVSAASEGYYTINTQVTVVANELTMANIDMNLQRSTPPEVVEYSPEVELTDSVLGSTRLMMKFNWDMDVVVTERAFSITPEVEGEITFEDANYTMYFTPKHPFRGGVTYTVKLDTTAAHPDDSFGNNTMVQEFSFQFTTQLRDSMKLVQVYPMAGDTGVYTKPFIKLLFDRELNTTNIHTDIVLLDSEGKELAKNLRTLGNNKAPDPYGSFYFEPANELVPGEEYTLVVDEFTQDVDGITVRQSQEYPFTVGSFEEPSEDAVMTGESAGFEEDEVNSLGVKSASCSASSSEYLFGKKSNKLSYRFEEETAYVTYSLKKNIELGEAGRIGAYIYGDFSDNTLQALFTSAAGDTVIADVCTLRFSAWRYVVADIPSLEAGYSFAGLRIVREDSPLGEKAEIYVDNVYMLPGLANSTPDVEKDDMVLFPNPATDIVFATVADVEEITVYDLTGLKLISTNAREVNVSDLPVGNYIVRVKVAGATYTNVIVKH